MIFFIFEDYGLQNEKTSWFCDTQIGGGCGIFGKEMAIVGKKKDTGHPI
jgi:hypothetical protein